MSLALAFAMLAVSTTPVSTHCLQEHQAAKILLSRDVAELDRDREALPPSFIFYLMHAYRRFQLEGSVGSAGLLLQALPQTKVEYTATYEIDAGDCAIAPGESRALDAAYDGMELIAAKALLLSPANMDQYVRFGIFATQDVHSRFGALTVPVCRAYPRAFKRSVMRMPSKDRSWFTTHIFDAWHCTNRMPEEKDWLRLPERHPHLHRRPLPVGPRIVRNKRQRAPLRLCAGALR